MIGQSGPATVISASAHDAGRSAVAGLELGLGGGYLPALLGVTGWAQDVRHEPTPDGRVGGVLGDRRRVIDRGPRGDKKERA